MNAIYILWLRELKKYVRSRTQIVASLAQPLLYLLALGFGLGPVFQRAGAGSYLQFVAPGVIGMMVLFTSMFSSISLLWDRQFGFLKETLVAPVPRILVMFGRTLGGATVAMLQGALMVVVCLIAGFRPASLRAMPLALLFILLIAFVFVALGVSVGSARYARVPAHYEFSSDAHFLFLRLSLPAGPLAAGARCAHNNRSTVIWRGWPAGYADWSGALRRTHGSGGTRPHFRRTFMFG